jgi:hypothetical protein
MGWFSDAVKSAPPTPKLTFVEPRVTDFENRYARGLNGLAQRSGKVQLMKTRRAVPKSQKSYDPTFKVGQRVLPWQARNGFWRADF